MAEFICLQEWDLSFLMLEKVKQLNSQHFGNTLFIFSRVYYKTSASNFFHLQLEDVCGQCIFFSSFFFFSQHKVNLVSGLTLGLQTCVVTYWESWNTCYAYSLNSYLSEWNIIKDRCPSKTYLYTQARSNRTSIVCAHNYINIAAVTNPACLDFEHVVQTWEGYFCLNYCFIFCFFIRISAERNLCIHL